MTGKFVVSQLVGGEMKIVAASEDSGDTVDEFRRLVREANDAGTETAFSITDFESGEILGGAACPHGPMRIDERLAEHASESAS